MPSQVRSILYTSCKRDLLTYRTFPVTKVLIHSHPQYAYLARCMLLSRRYNFAHSSQDIEYLLLHGANYIGHIDNHFKEYLIQSCLLHRLFGSIRQESFDFNAHVHIPDAFIDDLNHFVSTYFGVRSSTFRRIILDSIQDSLYRGLSPRAPLSLDYFLGSPEFQQNASRDEWINFLSLFFNYRRILEIESPDIVYASHGNYSPYISLICAARSLDIDFCIVHGGHQSIYQPNETHEYLSLSPLNAVRDALHCQFPEPFPYDLGHSPLNVRDERSFVKSAHRRSNLANSTSPKVDCINIALPIFTEVNHHYSSELSIFKNRYDWLFNTLSIIAKTSLPVIIKRHPHEAEQEPHLVNSLLDHIMESLPELNGRLLVVKSTDELNQAYRALAISGVGTEYFIYQSMSCCELPQVGRRAHSANPCFAHDSFVYTYKSYDQYRNSILAMELGTFQHLEVSQDEASLSALYIRICNEVGHLNPAGGFRIAFDQFYHFGTIRCTDTTQHDDLVDHCLANISFRPIQGRGLTILKEFTDDLQASKYFRDNYSLA